VGESELVIVTVDDFKATEEIVACLHRMFPTLDILARGHDMERCKILQAKGAWLVVSENLEASVALAQSALSKVSVDTGEDDNAIERYRKNFY
jgi:hypothetical protein